MSRLVRISKFLSYVLRHKPEKIGLSLDREGWAKISDLIVCANQNGHRLDLELIKQVVATNDKKRFTLSEDEQWIRAAQGHSTSVVSIAYPEMTPPEVLYHGTAAKNIPSILQKGLHSGSRHYVHLSDNTETARQVGIRYGKPVVLKIDTRKMQKHGLKFYQAENKVWLTLAVPPDCISLVDTPCS